MRRLWQCAIILVCTAIASAAMSQEMTRDQVQMIRELCETVKDARGQRTGSQLQADAQAKAAGLWGKLFDLSGGAKGTIDRETFEGLSREATAALLEGDRNCRERIAKGLLGAMQNTPQATSTPQVKAAPAVKSEATPQVTSTPQVQSPPKIPLREIPLRAPFRLDH